MIFIKFILGGLIVILIDYVSKSSKYYISGLIPLFPTFALIAHFLVYKYKGVEALKETALFGLFSLLPYAGYLLSVYLLSERLPFLLNIFFSIIFWFVLAYLIYIYFTNK